MNSTQERLQIINGFFNSFDGTRLFYTSEGPDDDSDLKSPEPLLFCHGLVCSKLHWKYQIEYFRKSYRTLSLDYRGHFRSEAPASADGLTLAAIGRDLVCLLDELEIPRVTVLGHSMGVNLALELCRIAPDRVNRMILANGSARRPLETLFSSNIFHLLLPVVSSIYDKYPQLMNRIWAAQGLTKIGPWIVGRLGFNPHLSRSEDIEAYVKMVSELDMIITLQLLKDYENYDASPWLPTLKAPALILAGAQDLMIPLKEQRLLQQLLPNSMIEVVSKGSHCPQMDLPELVNLIIERFLEKSLPIPKSTH